MHFLVVGVALRAVIRDSDRAVAVVDVEPGHELGAGVLRSVNPPDLAVLAMASRVVRLYVAVRRLNITEMPMQWLPLLVP